MKHKAPKKKEYFIRTTSKKTGAIILISTIIVIASFIGFFIYASDFATQQKQYEDAWRLMSCDQMKKDYDLDPFLWKKSTMFDMGCKI